MLSQSNSQSINLDTSKSTKDNKVSSKILRLDHSNSGERQNPGPNV